MRLKWLNRMPQRLARFLPLPKFCRLNRQNWSLCLHIWLAMIIVTRKLWLAWRQAEFEVRGMGNIVGPGRVCGDIRFGSCIWWCRGQSDILVLNMPVPSDDDPLLLRKLNELAVGDVYFQLDGQIQRLIQMLVQEMQASLTTCFLAELVTIRLLHFCSATSARWPVSIKSLALIWKWWIAISSST